MAQQAEQVAIARHASKDGRFKFFNTLPEDRYEAFISVPIIAPTGRVTGVINVQHRKSHRHSEHEKTLLSIIGHQVGGAIQNARLYEEASHRSRQITTLAKVGQLMSSGQYLDEMLQLIVSMIAEMMQAKVCSIMLVDTQKNELVLKAAKCSSEEYWQRPNLKIGKSLISRVVKERSPLMVRDVTKEEDYLYPELATKEGVRSLVSVPMIYKDLVIGVINVYSAQERVFPPKIFVCCLLWRIRRPWRLKTRSSVLRFRKARKRCRAASWWNAPRACCRNRQTFPRKKPTSGFSSKA